MPTERISASRTVAATPAQVFAVVSDPAGHVAIDGSGMLLAAPDAEPVTAVGDTFRMEMDRRPLGDIPEMGLYDVLVTITGLIRDEWVEWGVGTVGRTPIGHVYGYRLAPVDGGTSVTTYCDWSAVADRWKARISWPVVPVTMLEQTLVRLEQVLTSPS